MGAPLLFAVVLLCAPLTALPARAAAAGYSIVDLGTLGGASSVARAIDAAGEVAGSSTTASGDRHAFLWSGGAMRDLGTLGGATSDAYGIGDAGDVVGESVTAAGDTHAFLWRGGIMQDLGTLGGTFSTATAVNVHGDVVGASTTADGVRHAFLWSAGAMRDLGTLGGATSSANGINDAGEVVGVSDVSPSSFKTRPFVYGGATLTSLAVTGGAQAVNESGEIAGTMVSSTSANHAYLWNGSVAVDLGVLLFASYADGLDDAGDVVGYSTSMGSASTAFLFSGGVLSDLGTLLPVGSPWAALRRAYAINDRGQIAGVGDLAAGGSHAFLMTPPPPPDTTPPTAPTALTATASDETSIAISWNAASDNVGVAGYNVYVGGRQVGTTAGTSFTATGLTCATRYDVAVESVDAAGNLSARVAVGAATAGCAVDVLPFAHYALDGSPVDGSSWQHNGSAVGGAGWIAAGRHGGALALDGVDGHVDLPSLGLFYRRAFTLEAWVKARSATGDAGIVGSWSWDAGGGPMLWIDGSGRFDLTLNRGFQNYLTSSRTLVAGQWQHVAATYDGITARLYVDGVEVATRTFTDNVGGSDVWRIGAYGGSPTGFFDGSIDDVLIYRRALSTAEIAADMDAQAAPTTAVDLTPPTAVAATGATDTTVSIAWSAPADPAVTGYDVYTGATKAGTTTGTAFTVSGLTCGTAYHVSVASVDASGNESPRVTISASTAACPPPAPIAAYSFDVAPPTPPGATWTAAGHTGGGISLDGASGELDVPPLGTFYRTGFTLAAWAERSPGAGGEAAIVGTWTTAGLGGPMLWIDSNGHLRLTLGASSGNYLDSGFIVPAGEWHHYAGTYDGATARLYVDGRLVASLPFTGDVGGSDTWRIGAYGDTPTGFFAGVLDDVQVYAQPLTAVQVAALAATPAG